MEADREFDLSFLLGCVARLKYGVNQFSSGKLAFIGKKNNYLDAR